jgi:predicted NUDIX family NTP pyrophosphohydrolase
MTPIGLTGLMPKQAAGLLLYRLRGKQLEVFLVHPGGPFWARKDAAAWSIPKGEFDAGEEPLAAAQREFTEETGFRVTGPFAPLGTVRQPGGKLVHAFIAEADLDPEKIASNTFKLEWPPRSGRWAEFPEVDRAAWFPLDVAAEKVHRGQLELLTRLRTALKAAGS